MEQATTRYRIPEANMGVLTSKIEFLNRKATMLKQSEITFKVLGKETVEERINLTNELGVIYDFYMAKRTYFDVLIEGASPVLPGWHFLGIVQHLKDANIVRSVPGVEIPLSYRHGQQKCDHCQTIRNRKDTYIVRNKKGETKQVGHSCIKDFLGHLDVQALALFLTFLKEMEFIEQGMSGEEFVSKGFPEAVSTETYLAHVAESISKDGFISKTTARESNLMSTAERAWLSIYPPKDKEGYRLKPSEKSLRLASEALLWVRSIEGTSEYEHNLKTACSQDFITSREKGFAASVFSAYRRALENIEREKKREEDLRKLGEAQETSKHFGTVGKREVFILKVTNKINFETQFGWSTIYKFVDDAGNVAVWFSSSLMLDVGDRLEMKATVKKHDEYKGVKQTVLSRCTLVKDLTEIKTLEQESI